MTLRCSLFGHDFAEPETRREREERGNEVVTTVEEVRTCRRCDEERVVSENTEVTAVESGEPAGAVEPREPDPTAEQEHDPVADAEVDADVATDAVVDESTEDDAVILDEEEEEAPDRESGQWPDADDTRVDADESEESDAAPEETSDDADGDEAAAADAAADDGGEILVGDEEDAGPATTDEEAAEMPPGEATEPAGSPAADDVVEPEPVPEREDGVNVDAELVCPNCGFSEASLGSSHRQGDICPSCRQGYLAER